MQPRRDDAGPVGSEFERLLQSARCGCKEALGQLLDSYRFLLLAQANAGLAEELRAKQGASDVVQESLLEAHRDFPVFRGQTEAELRTWLVRILTHNLRNRERQFRETQKRASSREIPLDAGHNRDHLANVLSAADSSPSSVASRREEQEIVQEAMGRLSAEAQTIIRLHHHEDRPYQEIAQLLDCTARAAEKRFARAVEALGNQVEAILRERREHP